MDLFETKQKTVSALITFVGTGMMLYGASNLLSRVEYWSKSYKQRLENIYSVEKPSQDLEELSQDENFLKRNGWLTISGLAMFLGGTCVYRSKQVLPWSPKETSYKSFAEKSNPRRGG